MPLAVASRLGPYEIVSLIGAGGMGVVYKARDTRLHRIVAIKVLGAGFADDAGRQRRFEQEARAVALLQHPNILVLHDIGTHDGSPYLVSEFLEGETLRELLSRGPLALRKTLEYGREIAHGLAAAHDKGIAHRDLKPENILITKDGRAKILDFGLAKLADSLPAGSEVSHAGTLTELSQPGTVMGTVGYMSPEQVRGEDVDVRSDIFSFGAVLYEMASGRRAFQRRSPAESQAAILQQDPPELSSAGAGVPPGLELVVRRCLDKDRSRRFQSAHDLAFSLETLGALSGPVMAPPRLPAKRRARGLVLAGAVALTLAVFAAGWFLAKRNTPVPEVTFRQLTFQPGILTGARFSHDGQTIVYSGRFSADGERVYTTRPGSTEFRALDLPKGTSLLALSSTGELAVRLPPPPEKPGSSVLARVPLAGGVPRPLLEGVAFADWSPDGKDLAVVRTEGRAITFAARAASVNRIEFPIGTKLLDMAPPNHIGRLRVSPQGNLVAFIERLPGQGAHGRVCIVDRRGVKKVLSEDWGGLIALAWSDTGEEVYFDGTKGKGSNPAIRAVDLNGHERVLVQAPTDLTLFDAFQGRLLVQQTGTERMELLSQRPGETTERDLGWLNWSDPVDLSADGKRLLFDEARAGVESSVYLRTTDGAPPVRLGNGLALALSPDGAWAAAVETRAVPSPLLLIPTGPGETKKVVSVPLAYRQARFFADGRTLLALASEPGGRTRLYVQDLVTGHAKPITPEGVTGLALARDGSRAVTVGADQRVMVFPVEGGEGSPVPGSAPGDLPVVWSADGNALFVNHPVDSWHYDIYRLDLRAARRELWRSVTSLDAGTLLRNVLLTPDGRGHVFAFAHQSAELYLVEGVRSRD